MKWKNERKKRKANVKYHIHHQISFELSVNDINDACRLGIEIGVYFKDDDTWKQGVCI